MLDEHTFHIERLSRNANGKSVDGILSGFVFWGNFPTRLIDIDRLHPKKRVSFVLYGINQRILLEHPGFLEPFPYHGFYFIV